MRLHYFVFVLVCMTMNQICMAENLVTVPWLEFKTLYVESIERDLESRYHQEEPEPLFSIDEATYQLALTEEGSSGEVLLKGRILRGKPDPIALFGRDIAVSRVDEMQGGMLYSDSTGYKLLLQEAEFRLRFAIAVPAREIDGMLQISFAIPAAVKNALKLVPEKAVKLVHTPGLLFADEQYYFAPMKKLTLGFNVQTDQQLLPKVDIFSRISAKGNLWRLSSYFLPEREFAGTLKLRMPPGRILQTTLRRSLLKENDDGIEIDLSETRNTRFRIDYVINRTSETDNLRFTLPAIVGNQGREGEFSLEQVAGLDLGVTGDELQTRIPVGKLSPELREVADLNGYYMYSVDNRPISVQQRRLIAVDQAEIVLDEIYLFTSYTENGTALSVLKFELPGETGSKFRMPAVADAEIWSLNVNDQQQRVFRQDNGQWVIPLAATGPSKIELAYLRKGERLSLKGRLDLDLPATGLAARRLNVAIALAERVELIAMEGELEPVAGKTWPLVKGVNGRPYFFFQGVLSW